MYTPSSAKLAPLFLALIWRKSVLSREPRLGEPVKEIFSGQHRYLLEYLNRLTKNSCPAYLRNDQDDIVQNAFMGLLGKINTMAESLEACCSELQSNKPNQDWQPLLEMLCDCLEEIDKSWDRKHSASVRNQIAECIDHFERDQGQGQRERLLAVLKAGLLWLQKNDGRDIFADFYIETAVHWAISDAKKKFVRRGEVSPEEQEDGSQKWNTSVELSSWHRSLMIREAIVDCLSRLKEDKRRPVVLALLGYRHKEIADFLELSVRQTESRIRRAIEFLRECLNDKGIRP